MREVLLTSESDGGSLVAPDQGEQDGAAVVSAERGPYHVCCVQAGRPTASLDCQCRELRDESLGARGEGDRLGSDTNGRTARRKRWKDATTSSKEEENRQQVDGKERAVRIGGG